MTEDLHPNTPHLVQKNPETREADNVQMKMFFRKENPCSQASHRTPAFTTQNISLGYSVKCCFGPLCILLFQKLHFCDFAKKQFL